MMLIELGIFPSVIHSIILEYAQPTVEEQNMLIELVNVARDDYCWFDCQGVYDPPNRLCDTCSSITKLEDAINHIRKQYNRPSIVVSRGVVRDSQ